MVNSSHEAMHRIFQEYPGLFTGVSKALGLPFIQPTSITVLPTDLTEIQPVERRVDTLLRFDGDEPILRPSKRRARRTRTNPPAGPTTCRSCTPSTRSRPCCWSSARTAPQPSGPLSPCPSALGGGPPSPCARSWPVRTTCP
jgi:hypothetical protein